MKPACLISEAKRFRRLRIAARPILATVLLTAFAGCGEEEWQAETFPVQGKIAINGHPPQGAVVTLHPSGEQVDKRGSNPWGIVQNDGTFSLSTYEKGDGAPSGDYTVTIRWPLDVTDMSAAMTDRLDGAYSKEERSQWKVTIQEGENELPPIEIDGAKVQSKEDAKRPRRARPGPAMGPT